MQQAVVLQVASQPTMQVGTRSRRHRGRRTAPLPLKRWALRLHCSPMLLLLARQLAQLMMPHGMA